MITLEKLRIFQKYHGDGDAFVRFAKRKEVQSFEHFDWMNIDNLHQDIQLIRRGMTAESYKQQVEKRLREQCDSQETIDKLLDMNI